jgi:hypothetical protein
MKALDSRFVKNILLASIILLLGFGCKQNSSVTNHPKSALRNKTGKQDTAFTQFKMERSVSSDTVMKEHLASDTSAVDSSANHLQETARKLDIRYFKKSFNLHRKSYITLYRNNRNSFFQHNTEGGFA